MAEGGFNKTLGEELYSFQESPGGKSTLFKFQIKKNHVSLECSSNELATHIISSTAVMPEDPYCVNMQAKAFPGVKWKVGTSVKLKGDKVFLWCH